jgi:hypothetical protein
MIRNNRLLWTLQGLLALLFVFAGGAKLAMDPAELAAQSHMPAAFLQFIAVCELVGAVGLIVPALTGIRPSLTPLAAVGLIAIMIGATVTTFLQPGQPPAAALLPFVTGLLLAVVAYGRWRGQVSGVRVETPGLV